MSEKKRSASFASSIMLDILSAGLNKLSLRDLSTCYSHDKAHIPLETKREFVSFVGRRYGLPILLKAGTGVCDFVDTPIGKALLSRSTPHSLLNKWQRLEKYIHSNHYIVCTFGSTYAQISHQSRGDSSPTIEEDLAVLGVICGLIHYITDSSVTLTLDERGQQPVFHYPGIVTDKPIEHNEVWYVHWSRHIPSSDLPPLLDIAETNELSSIGIVAQTKKAIEGVGLLEANIRNTATLMGLSTRSLQRYLNTHNAKFASVLQKVRVHRASHLLLENSLSFAEIGFVCGFSDQAHFNRLFKKWTGMSPKQYCQFKSD
ncbi:helix-turn-helix domain-containing protein [Vibrio scophthalmi]|uniref:AraC family transcriptional regulator n=1 Tax=Vibrio scophthalmi TaxID=45658 RepID=UPI0038731E15